jgi:hypothetical protein
MKRKHSTKYSDRLVANINSNARIGYYNLVQHYAAHQLVNWDLQRQLYFAFVYMAKDFAALVATLNK